MNITLSLTGSIQKKYEYGDYGQRSLDSKTEIINNEFGYNGEAHTVDGLQYLRSRYYDPVTGVFISADSYRGEYSNPLSQNRYTYCNNNPYKYDDPSGYSGIRSQTTIEVFDPDGGRGTSSNPTVTPLLLNPVVQQTNTNSNTSTPFRDPGRIPSANTNAVIFDGGEVSYTSKADTEETGELEVEQTGTVSSIVTEPHDNTQPYGVETYEIQNTETKVIDVKDIAKGILSGIVMAGVGMLIAGAFALTAISAPVAAVATAVITGFAGAYVNAGVGALVENKSIEEYGRSQGYHTLKDYQNKLLKDAFIGAAIGATVAVVAAAVIYGSSLIGNSVADDVANAVVNQSDETAAIVSQSADDLARMDDEITVVKDKMNEISSNVINEDDFIPVSEKRVSHRQSELDFYKQNPQFKKQRSFMKGEKVNYGKKGSIRVDAYDEANNVAFEIKNYDLSTAKGRSSLVSTVKKQVTQRMEHLPAGTKQVIVLDIRGQQVTYKTMQEITTKMAMNNPDAGLSFMLMRY